MESRVLGTLVGADKFFKGVSARAAYMLPMGHECTLNCGSGSRSTRPGSFNELHMSFMTNERATGFTSYSGNPADAKQFLAGDPIVLDIIPSCSQVGPLRICRSLPDNPPAHYEVASTGEPAMVLDADGKPTGELKCINECNMPSTAPAEFPTFELKASNLSAKRCDPLDPYSWQTIPLATPAQLATGDDDVYGNQRYLEITDSCEDWIVWMRPTADIPADSALAIWGQLLTAGK